MSSDGRESSKCIDEARILLLAAALVCLGACKREPATYEDCILNALEGASKSDAALRLVVRACRDKYPLTSEPSQPAASASAEIQSGGLDLRFDPPSSAGFQVVQNEYSVLLLRRALAEGRPEAILTFDVAPPQGEGVNLIDAVKAQKAAIEAKSNGRFLGQVELGSQIGRAFSTRGRYTADDGSEVEEIRLLAVHPSGDRLLSLIYRYQPVPGDTQSRTEEAMAALGLIKGRATQVGDWR